MSGWVRVRTLRGRGTDVTGSNLTIVDLAGKLTPHRPVLFRSLHSPTHTHTHTTLLDPLLLSTLNTSYTFTPCHSDPTLHFCFTLHTYVTLSIRPPSTPASRHHVSPTLHSVHIIPFQASRRLPSPLHFTLLLSSHTSSLIILAS